MHGPADRPIAEPLETTKREDTMTVTVTPPTPPQAHLESGLESTADVYSDEELLRTASRSTNSPPNATRCCSV